jgi:DNA-binding MarR family transcriptional regulator
MRGVVGAAQSRSTNTRKRSKNEEFDSSAIALFANLDYACAGLRAQMSRVLIGRKLSIAAFNTLVLLAEVRHEGCAMRRLVTQLSVSRANVTGLVDSLERKGLVDRAAHDTDRRIRVVRLTETGRTTLEAILPQYYKRLSELLSGMSASEKNNLNELLRKLACVVNEDLKDRK